MSPEPQVLLFSDVDDTFLDEGRVPPAVVAALRDAASRIELVFVSSRTIPELGSLQAMLGIARDFITEDGTLTVVTSAAVADLIGASEPARLGTRLVRVVRHGASLDLVLDGIRAAAEGLGLEFDPALIEANRDREHTVLIGATFPGVHSLTAELTQAGFNVRVGRRWISVSRGGGGKGEAVRRYLAARRAAGGAPPVVAAIGDSENDASMLALVPRGFVINRPGEGHHAALTAIQGITVLEASGCLGWVEAVESLCTLGAEVP